jgi:hypothetical protein
VVPLIHSSCILYHTLWGRGGRRNNPHPREIDVAAYAVFHAGGPRGCSPRAVQISDLIDAVALNLLDKLRPKPGIAKSGWSGLVGALAIPGLSSWGPSTWIRIYCRRRFHSCVLSVDGHSVSFASGIDSALSVPCNQWLVAEKLGLSQSPSPQRLKP